MDQIKKQACSFLQEQYKTARLVLTGATRAEMLAEEVTNNDPCSPDAKTMTRIAAASFVVDDYWRIVDVLHKRFESIDWKQWRQSYKSLVLLEFLLTHGPEEFAEEFKSAGDVIEEIGMFQYVDDKGFNWGENMRKRSDHILRLLDGRDNLKEARIKALKITKEIQGFGSFMLSPTSSSSSTPSSASSDSPRASSFCSSFSTSSSPFADTSNNIARVEQLSFLDDYDDDHGHGGMQELKGSAKSNESERSHLWDCPAVQESGSLLDSEVGDEEEKPDGFVGGICSKIAGISPTRKCQGENYNNSISPRSFGRLIKKKV